MDKQYDIFLSHNSRDKPFVRELAQKLEEHGVIVWLDEREINPGQDWQDAIENALETVKSIAVLISANGLGPWEVPEMRAALVLSVDRSLPVIPILLPGTPQEMKLPLFLRSLTGRSSKWHHYRRHIAH